MPGALNTSCQSKGLELYLFKGTQYTTHYFVIPYLPPSHAERQELSQARCVIEFQDISKRRAMATRIDLLKIAVGIIPLLGR